MKTLGYFLFIAMFTLISQENIAQQSAIKIEEIVKDTYIKGKVTNLIRPNEYKVVVYVKTDKWYIHPYANQGEGESYASITPEGEWIISTLYRGFNSAQICVLVVKESEFENLPASMENPNSPKTLNNYALKLYSLPELTQNEWFGKL